MAMVGAHFSIERNSAGPVIETLDSPFLTRKVISFSSVVLPLFGKGEVHQQNGTMNNHLLMQPSEHDPQRNDERLIFVHNDVTAKHLDERPQQYLAVNLIRRRFDSPMPVKKRWSRRRFFPVLALAAGSADDAVE